MRFDIITANPKIVVSPTENGLIGRARKKGLVEVHVHHLRDYAEGKYRQIDDSPFGGGAGMILKPEPFFRCAEKLMSERDYDAIINFSPQGKKLNQKAANDYSLKKNFILLCGHYKGIDERVIKYLATEEVSLGDYVLSCGDLAAVIFMDAVARLVPGALSDSESSLTDTFQVDTVFDAPQYTRPEKYGKYKVPAVLLSGNHAKVKEWREKKAKAKYRKSKRK
ncbi:MAG: tRNA (guanosine(37)-N1)-methyltransferase TrmD [Ignavibacteria bacterium]|nr:tRNA (guanosine(37)-N1)-methyltransferase TrmD [Ignavibacteria bacterium]